MDGKTLRDTWGLRCPLLYGSPLQIASYKGNKPIVLLLNNGADVNAPGGFYGSALQIASYKGNKPIVLLLLNNGADVNAPGGYMALLCKLPHDLITGK